MPWTNISFTPPPTLQAVPTGLQASDGSSGGGLVAILAGAISEDLTMDVSGGEAANGFGGPGGLGAALKQIIDT